VLGVVIAAAWVNANPGWVALIAAGLVVIVTAVYVWFTWKANSLALEALNNDRRQYDLAVKNRQDAAMPAVVIRFIGTTIKRAAPAPTPDGVWLVQERGSIGSVPPSLFDDMNVFIDSNFVVTNHGPGPALLWAEIHNRFRKILHLNGVLASQPILIPPLTNSADEIVLVARIMTEGVKVFPMIRTTYATVGFRWSAYSSGDTSDSAEFALKAEMPGQTGIDGWPGDVDDAILARVFSQKDAYVVPDPRSYGQASYSESGLHSSPDDQVSELDQP
jgi:hypothetical protein